MAEPTDWRRVYELAKAEMDPTRRSEFCDHARRLIQDRSLELANSSTDAKARQAEEDALNQALRDLWRIQKRSK